MASVSGAIPPHRVCRPQDRLRRRRRIQRRHPPGARLASACVMAENTEIASSSGGSPTAFELWMVGSRLRPGSNSSTRKSAGTSEQVGIL